MFADALEGAGKGTNSSQLGTRSFGKILGFLGETALGGLEPRLAF